MEIFNFGRKKKESSSAIAKNRLKFIVIQDRMLLSPSEFEKMKQEMMEVISKYVNINATEVDISIDQAEPNSRQNRITADIPINPKN